MATEIVEFREDAQAPPCNRRRRIPIRWPEAICVLLTVVLYDAMIDNGQSSAIAADDAQASPPTENSDSDRARTLMQDTRADIWSADDPDQEEDPVTLRENARRSILEARTLFAEALAGHEAEFRQFPRFIPPEQTDLRQQRMDVEQKYLRSRLDLAETWYHEAQTFDPGNEQRTLALERAVDEFREIHDAHRSQIAGLIARLWQGKCFQEMGMIREALGIFNEILAHPGTSKTMQALQDHTLRFRLICLNDESRRDYRLVIHEAQEWREQDVTALETDSGLGILFEMARAQEQLGRDRTLPEAQRIEYLNEALENARLAARHPGELKAPALALIKRVTEALDPGGNF